MSTHAHIGIKFKDGGIHGCYVHYDGGSITPRLVDYLQTNTITGLAVLIAQAQACGGIRSFHCAPWGNDVPPVTEFLNDNEPYIVDENIWEDYEVEYQYLVDYETGTINATCGKREV